jgi:hypothetical protein
MADKKKSKDGKVSGEKPVQLSISLPIEWHIPDDVVTQFSNHMMVQRGLTESYILFFEVQPPIVFGTPEQVAEQKKALKSVRAKCIARIVVPNEVVPTFVRTIQETLGQAAGQSDEVAGSDRNNGMDK